MRICHLTSVHPFNDPRIFHKECTTLVQAGFTVSLVTSENKNFVQNGIAVFGVGKPKNRLQRAFVTIPKVFFSGLKTRSKIFHIHDPELLVLAPLLKCFGKKVIYDIHEDLITSVLYKEYLPKFIRGCLASLLGFFEVLIAKFCYLIVAEKYYADRFPQSIAVLNYPLPVALPENTALSFDLKTLSSKFSWYFYSGNITTHRGAFLHLNILSAKSDTALFMIGKCEKSLLDAMYKELDSKKIERSRLCVIGVDEYVSKEWIDFALYNGSWKAGLALFPANPHYERKELTKFFEYVEAGLPVLATNFKAWTLLIMGQKMGMTVDANDQQKLQAALEQVASFECHEQIKVLKSRYQWSTQADSLLQLYRQIENDLK